MAANILGKHKLKVAALELVPSSGGRFEVSVGDEVVFSKAKLGKFPQEGEAERLVEAALEQPAARAR